VIDYAAFRGCNGLITLTIPNSVKTIGVSAFSNCSRLTTLTILDSVTTISDRAFSNCSGLSTLMIPDSVTTIGIGAFSNCSELTTLTIPDGVTTIDDFAFNGCRGLATLTVPDSMTSIGEDAFSGCDALQHIYISQTQQDGFERTRDLLPAHLRDKVVAKPPAGRLTKGAGAPSTTTGSNNFKKARLFHASVPALPLATLSEESEKQISSPGQVQLIFKAQTDAQAMQNALEQAGMHAGAAAAQYAIEEISKTDESNPAASAASAAATDSLSGYLIKISKVEYNQLMGDDSAYDQLSQSANGLQP